MKYYVVRIYFNGRLINEFSLNDYDLEQIAARALESIEPDRNLDYYLHLGGDDRRTSPHEVYITTAARLSERIKTNRQGSAGISGNAYGRSANPAREGIQIPSTKITSKTTTAEFISSVLTSEQIRVNTK